MYLPFPVSSSAQQSLKIPKQNNPSKKSSAQHPLGLSPSQPLTREREGGTTGHHSDLPSEEQPPPAGIWRRLKLSSRPRGSCIAQPGATPPALLPPPSDRRRLPVRPRRYVAVQLPCVSTPSRLQHPFADPLPAGLPDRILLRPTTSQTAHR